MGNWQFVLVNLILVSMKELNFLILKMKVATEWYKFATISDLWEENTSTEVEAHYKLSTKLLNYGT